MSDSGSNASCSSAQSDYSDDEVSAESEDLMDELKEEGEMPLEELMRRFSNNQQEDVPCPTSGSNQPYQSEDSSSVSKNADDIVESKKKKSLFSILMKTGSVEDDERSDDCEYDPIFDLDDFYKSREPRIGSEYQVEFIDNAVVTEEDSERTGSLVWNPNTLNEESVTRYLLHFYGIYLKQTDVTDMEIFVQQTETEISKDIQDCTSKMCNTVPDNEHALFQLLLFDFDMEEAIKYWQMNPPIYISIASTPHSLPIKLNPIFDVWSEDEVRLFEWSIRAYGKHFHTMQEKVLPGRTVSELVDFYYWWKMTDRYRFLRATGKSSKCVISEVEEDRTTEQQSSNNNNGTALSP